MFPVPLNSWKISSSIRLPVSISAVATMVKRARFFGVTRGRENFSRNFHGAGIDTAAHGASATAHRIIKSARRAGDGIEQNENVLARFDQTFGALDRQLGDTSVALNVAVVGAGDDLGFRMRALEVGHFLRPFVHQQDDQLHLRMILHHCIGNVMQKSRFSGAGRRDDEPALSHSERGHQIHDPGRIAIRDRFEFDPLVRIDRGQFFERPEALIFGRLFAIDLSEA